VRVREVGAKLTEVVPVRTKVVVDDVETHGEAFRVRCIDEPLKSGRTAVRLVHRIQSHAVVAPTAIAGERRDGHELDHLHPAGGQIFEMPSDNRVESPSGGEGADVQFVGDGATHVPAIPRGVAPRELRAVESSGKPVHAVRLPRAAWVGERAIAVNLERVVVAWGHRRSSPPAAGPFGHRLRVGVLLASCGSHVTRDGLCFRRPDGQRFHARSRSATG